MTALLAAGCTNGVIEGNATTISNSAPTGSGGSGMAAGSTSGTGTGNSGAIGSGGQGAAGNTTATGGTAVAGDPNAAGLFPVQRLTAREYLNTVRDLLTDTTLTSDDVPDETDDTSNNAFPFRQPTAIATVDAAQVEKAAESLATNVSSRLSTYVPCNPTTASAEASCASQFISTFAPKMYRRPLSATETTNLTTLYQTGRTTLALDFKGAIGLLIEAMLQSPGFIYHWEKDPGPAIRDGAVVQLGNYQIASRLSYFLWGSMPDATLFAAAAAGQLTTASQIQAQVVRMLKDPKAQDTIADFFDDLLDVNTVGNRPKDPAFYPMFNSTLASAMETEFRSFTSAVVLGGGSFSDLFTTTKSSVNQPLAAVYGLTGITGTTPTAVSLSSSQRSGMLTLAGFLTVTGQTNGSDPVRRGHAILTRLMCGRLPDPPATVPPVPAPTKGISTRQRFITHDQNSCTAGCHNVMDPIGFGFEHYDGIGTFRTIDPDSNTAIDASGSIALDGQNDTFQDALGLVKMLATSPEVQACFSTQWVRYALNRWDTAADTASIQAATTAFQSSSLNIPALIQAVATSRTFRYRAPDTGEVLQ